MTEFFIQNSTFFVSAFFLVLIGVGVIVVFWLRKSKVDEGQSYAIKDLQKSINEVVGQLKEIGSNVDGTSRAMTNQVSSFTKETVQVREELKRVQEEMRSISSFQEIFKSPKLRGQWGEASLGHILSEHFPRELYEPQHRFLSEEKVDAVLRLPNKKLLPIDAKFSSINFEKMIEASGEERKYFEKKFTQDVKFNIDQIASKYILPSENTVDYALMYIPAEAIFHEIMFNLREEDLVDYARRKKIILTSPNTIYLTLRTIEQWFRDVQVSRRTQEILKKLSKIQIDAEKLMGDFGKLGNHLRNAVSSYDHSEKRLNLFSDKIERLLEIKEPKKLKKSNRG